MQIHDFKTVIKKQLKIEIIIKMFYVSNVIENTVPRTFVHTVRNFTFLKTHRISYKRISNFKFPMKICGLELFQ